MVKRKVISYVYLQFGVVVVFFFKLRNLSLPVQREAVDTKLVLSDLMVDMLKQFSTEARGKRELETQKGNIQKVIYIATFSFYSISFS